MFVLVGEDGNSEGEEVEENTVGRQEAGELDGVGSDDDNATMPLLP